MNKDSMLVSINGTLGKVAPAGNIKPDKEKRTGKTDVFAALERAIRKVCIMEF